MSAQPITPGAPDKLQRLQLLRASTRERVEAQIDKVLREVAPNFEVSEH